ncbi:hypothetical protein CALCODRAFT_32047 [Calocera cornea HHB12733]|uniref:Uncharacterized protein n=1 Tax=Calocera cornea HHB12733 TaxID=1353952 RepID=A0A165E218_9BASI|nr:hypothetical protein CALCODRAFT_32047 [Calocera cornea HHB12733]
MRPSPLLVLLLSTSALAATTTTTGSQGILSRIRGAVANAWCNGAPCSGFFVQPPEPVVPAPARPGEGDGASLRAPHEGKDGGRGGTVGGDETGGVEAPAAAQGRGEL